MVRWLVGLEQLVIVAPSTNTVPVCEPSSTVKRTLLVFELLPSQVKLYMVQLVLSSIVFIAYVVYGEESFLKDILAVALGLFDLIQTLA